jgi:hypothetical protein
MRSYKFGPGLDDACERRAAPVRSAISTAVRVACNFWKCTRGVRKEGPGAERREAACHPLPVCLEPFGARGLDGDGEDAEEQRTERKRGREAAKGEHCVLASG